MSSTRILLGVLALTFCAIAVAHDACDLPSSTFSSGSQHCDCDYTVPPGTGTDQSNATQHDIDLAWIRMVHQYAVTNMARYPFGAALVDSRTNTLVTIGYNNFFTADPFYSSIAVSHAETVVMTNASINIMPGSYNATNGNRKVDPNWKYMTLYGNIEACPMCAQAAIWRGLRQMVFGARASVLQAQRCWTQPTLTAAEVVDHSAGFAPFQFVRGPFEEVEDEIVLDFKQQCTTSTTTTGTASAGARSASTPFSSLMDNVRALV